MYQFYRFWIGLKNNQIKFALICVSMFICLPLPGCHSNKPVYFPIKHALSPEQRLEVQRHHDINMLLQQDIMVTTLGETKRIIIPSDVIFSLYSANLLTNQCNKLDLVADLIASYSTIMVRVDAYSDNFFPMQMSDALTVKQAQTVADYLRRHHMDTRLILRHGYGPINFVASNQTGVGRGYNRRIEITFRIYPPRPMY